MENRPPTKITQILTALFIAAVSLWIYWPALHGDWLWDDGDLIVQNALVRDPGGWWKVWLKPGGMIDYFPLTVSVEWVEWHLWGAQTLGYHLVNLVLHVTSALLFWRLLAKFDLKLAWLGGLLFAIHPMMVESVAWMAELKNTLSLPPFLLAMIFWIDFEERRRLRDYFLAVGLFLAAMLCKTTMVTFPFVILLYAWWKRGRVGWSDLRASAPFFGISLLLGLVTIWFNQHHAIGWKTVPMGGISSRIATAGLCVAFYLSKTVFPIGLLTIYPKWNVEPPSLVQFLPWPILAGILYGLWTKRNGWGRHALLGLGFFLITLLPFVGFKAASFMRFTWVMDHLLYLPILGLIGLSVARWEQLQEKFNPSARWISIGLLALVATLLSFASHRYAKLYINQETLWNYTLRHNPDAWLAQNNLGEILWQRGQVVDAIAHYQMALKTNPDYPEAENNLGLALAKTGHLEEAIRLYQRTIELNPDFAEPESNLAMALVQKGEADAGIFHYLRAIQINPRFAQAENNLGLVYLQKSQVPAAIARFQQALGNRPDFTDAHINLGIALYQSGDAAGAIAQFEAALKIDPANTVARNNLAVLQATPPTK